jgi:competence protein ComEC
MVGGGATVVRGSVMAVLGLLAVYVSRTYIVVRGLALAGFCMVLWNPFVLVYDSGFQLSYMATLGLILGAPLFARHLERIPNTFQVREILSATLATQLAVLPLLIYHIGTVSLVAPLVNVLVLPLMPFAMLAGFAAGAVGAVLPLLAYPFAWMTHVLLSYVVWVVEVFARIPYADVAVPPVGWWVAALMYAMLAVWYLRAKGLRTLDDRTVRSA